VKLYFRRHVVRACVKRLGILADAPRPRKHTSEGLFYNLETGK
jgi:hypothetical protein